MIEGFTYPNVVNISIDKPGFFTDDHCINPHTFNGESCQKTCP